MSNKEIVLLFKRNYNMTEREWHCFCERYAKRNTSTVIEYIKELCNDLGIKFTNQFKKDFKHELNRSLQLKSICM